MKPLNKAGFTIIETMLFLSITGLLIMGVLIGTGNSINTQRYRDSVTTLQAFFQQQYSDVANISNDNAAGNLKCYGDNKTVPRGQSNCVVLGHLITTVKNNGISDSLLVRYVLGYIPAKSTEPLDDVEIFKNTNGVKPNGYNIIATNSLHSTYTVEWSASLVPQGLNTAQQFSVLIVRSPSTGIIRTFLDPNNSVNNPQAATLLQANQNTPIVACVNSNGLLTGPRMAVKLNAGSTSAAGVETLGENSGC